MGEEKGEGRQWGDVGGDGDFAGRGDGVGVEEAREGAVGSDGGEEGGGCGVERYVGAED